MIASVVASSATTLTSTYQFSLAQAEDGCQPFVHAPDGSSYSVNAASGRCWSDGYTCLSGRRHSRAPAVLDKDVLVDAEDQLLDAAATGWRRR